MERVRFKFKNWKLKFISVIVLLGMGQNVLAQKSFSRDTTKFIEEYTTYVMQVNSGEAKAETKLFKEYWSNGKFTEPQRSSINELANKMLISGMKPEPYFLLLTKCINAWVTKGLSADLLKNFIDISFKNLEKDKLGFVSFMRTCYPLFTKNVLTDNGQRQWYVRDNNYNLSDAGGFSIKFLQSDLVCRTLADSMVIYETTGTFFPNKTKWEGDAGKMTWIRHGREDAFVVFKKYTIDLSGSSISLKDVKYTNQDFFAGEVEGVFKDKVSYALDTTIIARFPYPEFSTKEANVEIKNLIGDEAKYYGGISVKGKEIFSQSFGDEPATIEILYKGKPKVIAKSSTFKISENAVISQGTEIFVLMDSGQIYHPKAIFNYNFSKKLMIVSRGKDGLTRANFQDDYHNLEFKVDNINWKQEEPFIEFDNLSSDKPAIIESSNYFKQFKYDKIQGMLAANPIEVMIRYVIKNRVRDFSLDDYAAYRRNKKKNLMKQVYDLADGEDVFILSNGHISPAFYSVLARSGYFPVKELATFRKLDSRLQGHPATEEGLPGVRVATGSLGQGLSFANGIALQKRLDKDDHFVFCNLGDGELQEGQNWEAIMFAAHNKLSLKLVI